MRGWSAELRGGALNLSYGGELVIEGLRVRASDGERAFEFDLEPYGDPYDVAAGGSEWRVHILRLAPVGEGPGNVLAEVHCGRSRVMLRLYPRARLTFAAEAAVRWGREPYLCRVEAGQHWDVVQAALGPADSLLCDSIFDKWGDRLLRLSSWGRLSILAEPDGRTFTVEAEVTTQFGVIPELLAAAVTERYVAEHLGMPYYEPYDTSRRPRPPAGWCSWYYYGRDITEADVVANADWLAEHLKPFGLEYVQLDDGYQGETWLDWNERFPRGGAWLARYVRSRGLKPGIWLVPQGVPEVDTRLLEERPHWFIRRPDGEVFRGFANYPYVDPTNPEVRSQWIGRTLRTMREWGFEYFKLDGQGEMHQWYALCRGSMHDRSLTPDEAYRGMLRLIREAVGPDSVILICATQWRAMGYGDTCRTGTDVSPSKLREGVEAFRNALRATFSNYWMHTIAWYCDPDVIMVRPELPYEAAKAWASLLGLSGQVLMVSDNMPELPEERVELLRRVLPPQPVRPMDLFPRDPEGPYPQIWDLKVATSWGRWDVVGVFRWFESDPAEVRVAPEKLGLRPGRYLVYEVWDKRFVGELGDGISVRLEPGSCRVLCVRPLLGVPELVGTSRHITQGYPDLIRLEWGEGRSWAEGESLLVGGDPYEVRFLVDWGGARVRCAGVAADGADAEWREEGRLLVVTLRSDESARVRWRVHFERA